MATNSSENKNNEKEMSVEESFHIDVPETKTRSSKKAKVSYEVDTAKGVETPGDSTYVVKDHRHNGTDSPKIREFELAYRRERIHERLPGASASTSANYGVVFVAEAPCYVRVIRSRHETAGTDGGSVGLNVQKLTGTTVPGSGDDILSSDISLKGTINTLVDGTLVTSRTYRTLNKGDALCLSDSGVLTSLAGLFVIIEVEYI